MSKNIDLIRLILWVCSSKDPNFENLRLFKITAKLQKLVFLAQYDSDYFLSFSDVGYKFKADKFGPYSMDLEKVLRILRRQEEIEINQTNDGLKYFVIKDGLKNELKKIKKEILQNFDLINILRSSAFWYKKDLSELLSYIYRNPKFYSKFAKTKKK